MERVAHNRTGFRSNKAASLITITRERLRLYMLICDELLFIRISKRLLSMSSILAFAFSFAEAENRGQPQPTPKAVFTLRTTAG
jgi:hypothetical protein